MLRVITRQLPRIRWVAAGLVLLFAGVLLDTARSSGTNRLRSTLAPDLLPVVPGAPIQAAFLLQLRDCSGNLQMLEALHRPTVRERVHLAVLWYVGPAGDSTNIRAILPSWTERAPLRPAPKRALAELRRLGHQETPLLIVLDQFGRVRLTTQSPRSAREYAGLLRMIEGLTMIAEL